MTLCILVHPLIELALSQKNKPWTNPKSRKQT